ncbi:hypothetical protein A2U01_0048344, partial [Trifolium medium]|nr:hypothetical protein [Trifolium medium]
NRKSSADMEPQTPPLNPSNPFVVLPLSIRQYLRRSSSIPPPFSLNPPPFSAVPRYRVSIQFFSL